MLVLHHPEEIHYLELLGMRSQDLAKELAKNRSKAVARLSNRTEQFSKHREKSDVKICQLRQHAKERTTKMENSTRQK